MSDPSRTAAGAPSGQPFWPSYVPSPLQPVENRFMPANLQQIENPFGALSYPWYSSVPPQRPYGSSAPVVANGEFADLPNNPVSQSSALPSGMLQHSGASYFQVPFAPHQSIGNLRPGLSLPTGSHHGDSTGRFRVQAFTGDSAAVTRSSQFGQPHNKGFFFRSEAEPTFGGTPHFGHDPCLGGRRRKMGRRWAEKISDEDILEILVSEDAATFREFMSDRITLISHRKKRRKNFKDYLIQFSYLSDNVRRNRIVMDEYFKNLLLSEIDRLHVEVSKVVRADRRNLQSSADESGGTAKGKRKGGPGRPRKIATSTGEAKPTTGETESDGVDGEEGEEECSESEISPELNPLPAPPTPAVPPSAGNTISMTFEARSDPHRGPAQTQRKFEFHLETQRAPDCVAAAPAVFRSAQPVAVRSGWTPPSLSVPARPQIDVVHVTSPAPRGGSNTPQTPSENGFWRPDIYINSILQVQTQPPAVLQLPRMKLRRVESESESGGIPEGLKGPTRL